MINFFSQKHNLLTFTQGFIGLCESILKANYSKNSLLILCDM